VSSLRTALVVTRVNVTCSRLQVLQWITRKTLTNACCKCDNTSTSQCVNRQWHVEHDYHFASCLKYIVRVRNIQAYKPSSTLLISSQKWHLCHLPSRQQILIKRFIRVVISLLSVFFSILIPAISLFSLLVLIDTKLHVLVRARQAARHA
jgi:hypothetical protein